MTNAMVMESDGFTDGATATSEAAASSDAYAEEGEMLSEEESDDEEGMVTDDKPIVTKLSKKVNRASILTLTPLHHKYK